MKRLRPINVLILLAIFCAPFAWAQEGTITTPESVSATKIRVEGHELQRGGGEPYAIVTLARVTDAGEIVDTIVVQIRNGANAAGMWLSGTGASGQPIGYLTEVHGAIQPTGTSPLGNTYTGQPGARINRAVLAWFAGVGRPAIQAGADSITVTREIPEFTQP
jgi:hypothetical protein